ncbi:hypothetical protein [Streptomyces sp. MST-110588]|uniref:hypothetical protein n=1 Tax=Streptomyces sp. MST-110588 TaxID=2833628 RepID=UPI001F5CE988|nr:hypothetical protein [Streptomyces sp. MST-110588]UNO43388.1 hypothetical protein KGS77_32795 [Streptomyces sp. MST-110588]
MHAESITAVCAVVIAVASLAVSVYQAHAMRQHNRHSVRPILQLHQSWAAGRTAGIRLINSGFGPAVVIGSTPTVDGTVIGEMTRGRRVPREREAAGPDWRGVDADVIIEATGPARRAGTTASCGGRPGRAARRGAAGKVFGWYGNTGGRAAGQPDRGKEAG